MDGAGLMLKFPNFPLHMQFFGQEQCPPEQSYGPKTREHYLFVNVVKGKGIYRAEGKTHALQAGDSFLMFAGQLGYYSADEYDPWAYRWIGFGGSHCLDFLDAAGLNHQQPIITHRFQDELTGLFGELFELEGSAESKEWASTGILYKMLALWHRESSASGLRADTGAIGTGYVQKAIQYMRLNYSEPLSITAIAAYVGLERSYFSKLFKQQTGTSPHAYLLIVRLEKAVDLLLKTDLTIEQIAYSAGFGSLHHFSAMFAERYKQPPSQFRKQTHLR